MDDREFFAALRKRQIEARKKAIDAETAAITLERMSDHLHGIIGHGQWIAATCPERLREHAVDMLERALVMVRAGDSDGLTALREKLSGD